MKLTKSTAEVYMLRNIGPNNYWADITLHAPPGTNTGRISIASDFGNWQNYWGACGKEFKDFLTALEIDYFCNKLRAECFRKDLTCEWYLERIKEREPSTSLNELLIKEVESLAGVTREIDFVLHYIDNCRFLTKAFGPYPNIQYGIDRQFERFWEIIWLPFKEILSNEKKVPVPPVNVKRIENGAG